MSFTSGNGEHTMGPITKSLSRNLYPRTMDEILDWATDMWLHDGLYTQTIRKGVRYFMTELEIMDTSSANTADNYQDFIDTHYDILEEAAKTGDEAIGFGNSFTSVYIPILRILICSNKECNTEFNFHTLRKIVKFDPQKLTFSGKCPACGKNITFGRKDIHKTGYDSPPKILRWDPHMIKISYNSTTESHQYFLDPKQDNDFTKKIRNGDPFFMEDTPWEIVKAVCERKEVKFDPDNIYHMKVDPPAFLKQYTRGWGMPPFMSDFSSVVMLKLLDRYNEAILSDYLVPMRAISPAQTDRGSTDTMMGPDLAAQVGFDNIKESLDNMIQESRRDPTKIHTIPFPLQYQVMGGEAKQLIPVEIQKHYEMRILQNMGFPMEFIEKSINRSAGPLIGFKIFERTWQAFSNSLNNWLTWFINRIGDIKQWERIKARTIPASLHEDPAIKQMKLQLASSKVISMTDGLKPLGLDYREQQNKIMEEQKQDMNQQMKFQEDMEGKNINMEALRQMPAGAQLLQQAMQQGAMGGGGAESVVPGGGGGEEGGLPDSTGPQGMMQNPSLTGMEQQAEQYAQELFAMDSTQRISKLRELADHNKILHAVTKEKLKEIRQNAQMEGQMMAQEQAEQQAGM